MSRSKKRKKGTSQEVKLLASLLCIVIIVAAVCIVMSKNDKNNTGSSSSYISSSASVSGNKSPNISSETQASSNNTVTGNADVVSGTADIESSVSSSVVTDATLVFDDTAFVGNTPDSWNLILVNSTNKLDKDYVPELHTKKIYGVHAGGYQISSKIYDAYTAMVAAAKKDGVSLVACSVYRQYSSQERNYNNRVTKLMNEGMTREAAEAKAATVIARPGTSEHQTGMAVDFNPCTSSFENSTQYKWLSKNAEDYGFIQRYKAEKSSITGIIDEPWHYRYVGVEHAKAINDLGMCLEEYIDHLNKQ